MVCREGCSGNPPIYWTEENHVLDSLSDIQLEFCINCESHAGKMTPTIDLMRCSGKSHGPKNGLCPCLNSYWFIWWYSVSPYANTLTHRTGLWYCEIQIFVDLFYVLGSGILLRMQQGDYISEESEIENKYMSSMDSTLDGVNYCRKINRQCEQWRPQWKYEIQVKT